MNIDTSNLLNSILEELSSLSYVHPGDVPNINLYMDQVTTFMDEQLASTKRYPDDKILTKTMINNYTKNNLLPPPVKKKYSREHLLLLVFIYYFKNILSIKDYWNIDITFAVSHFHDVCISKEGHTDGMKMLIDIKYHDNQLSLGIDEIISRCNIPMPVDAKRNMMNASSNFEIIQAILGAVRDGKRTKLY